MLPEPSTLVRLVMETLAVKGPTALARELGMRDYGAPRKIGDWLDGKYSPNYEATMLMLDRAGFLNLEASTPGRVALALAPLSPRQRYLLAAEGDGLAVQELASVFNTTEEEIQAELEAAREEFAAWQETPDEEQTSDEEETEPAEQSPPLEKPKKVVLDFDLHGEPEDETEGETGELTLEIIERQIEKHRELAEATKAEMEAFQARLQEHFDRIRAQTTHTPGKEVE